MHDVLIVPDIKKDLLFVIKLPSDYALTFEFDVYGFGIKDRITQKTVAIGKNQKGL